MSNVLPGAHDLPVGPCEEGGGPVQGCHLHSKDCHQQPQLSGLRPGHYHSVQENYCCFEIYQRSAGWENLGPNPNIFFSHIIF